MNLKKKITLAAVLVGMTALAGCGGSSTSATAPPTQTVAGVVADGYLTGAVVCLDTNNDKSCAGETYKATSQTGGAYSILNVTATDLAQYPIVVEVPVGASDSERGAVTSAYFMSAPAGKPEFVSPLTTLVQNQIETNGLSVTEAVATVKTQLGLAALSPLDNYHPGVSGASAESVMAAGVAKVIATTIADNKAAIETALFADRPVTVQQVVNLIVQQVMQNLATVVQQVNIATNNGATALAESRVAGVVSASGTTVDVGASLLQDLAAASITTVASDLITAATAGMYGVEQWQNGWDQVNNVALYSYYYGKVLFNSSNNTISFSDYLLGNGAWVADTNNDEIYLTSAGWKVETATGSGKIDPVSGVYSSPNGYDKSQVRAVKLDVAGQPIAPYLKGSFQAIPTTLTGNFPAGSSAYRLTFVPSEDTYNLDNGDSLCKTWNNSTNSCDAWYTTLTELLSASQYVGYNNGVSFRLGALNSATNTGLITIYIPNSMEKVVGKVVGATASTSYTSTYKLTTVYGVPMIIADLTSVDGRFMFAAVYNNQVRSGKFSPANVARMDNSLQFNKTATDAIMAAAGLPTSVGKVAAK